MVTLALSDVASAKTTEKEVFLAPEGGEPLISQLFSSSESHEGMSWADADGTAPPSAGIPSTLTSPLRPVYERGVPMVAFSTSSVSSTVSSWLPTTMAKAREVAEKPVTSDATSWKANVSGGSTSELRGGVRPENERLPGSNEIHAGTGELSPATA